MSTTSKKPLLWISIIVVVVVIALAIVIVAGRNSGGSDDDEQSGGNSASSDSMGTAGNFEWKDKKADAFGRMGYLPVDDDRGQILSTTPRTYSGNDTASTARPEGVVFEATRFSGGWPIPFSESDGPTGFDGNVPVGYTKSSAGAALAATAYYTMSAWPATIAEYTDKVLIDPPAEQVSWAKEQSRNATPKSTDEITISGNSSGHYEVSVFDGDYAQVIVYTTSPSTSRVLAAQYDLNWVDGMWKVKTLSAAEPMDSLPEGAQTW